mgnify:FL=1
MQTNRNFSKNYAPFILYLQEKVLLKKLHKKRTVAPRAVRQALYSFFDEYDFAGKTIIPFNAHNGSRFSNTIETIAELEPDAEVIEDGFTVNERDVPDAAGLLRTGWKKSDIG